MIPQSTALIGLGGSPINASNLLMVNGALDSVGQPLKKRRGRPPKYLKEAAVLPQSAKQDSHSSTNLSNLNLLDFARSLSAVISSTANSTTVSAGPLLAVSQPMVTLVPPVPLVTQVSPLAQAQASAAHAALPLPPPQRSPSSAECHVSVDELTMEHFLATPTRVVQQFKMFFSNERCPDEKCAFVGQQHFHCLRERCHHSSVRLDLLNLHFRSFHNLIRIMEGFEFFDRNVQCRRAHCPNSKVNAHFHCTKPRCDYSFVRYSTMAKHSRKHAENERGTAAPSLVTTGSHLHTNGVTMNGSEDNTGVKSPPLLNQTAVSKLATATQASLPSNEVLKAEPEFALRSILQLPPASTLNFADPTLRNQLTQYIEAIQGWCQSMLTMMHNSKSDQSGVLATSSPSPSNSPGELTQSVCSAFKPVLRGKAAIANNVNEAATARTTRCEHDTADHCGVRSGHAAQLRESATSSLSLGNSHGAEARLTGDERPLNLTVRD